MSNFKNKTFKFKEKQTNDIWVKYKGFVASVFCDKRGCGKGICEFCIHSDELVNFCGSCDRNEFNNFQLDTDKYTRITQPNKYRI